VAVEQVAGLLAGDGSFALADKIEIKISFFRGDFVADIK
jgi:hypothetical protein